MNSLFQADTDTDTSLNRQRHIQIINLQDEEWKGCRTVTDLVNQSTDLVDQIIVGVILAEWEFNAL